MGTHRHRKRKSIKKEKDSLLRSRRAPVAVVILILNVFQWIAFRGLDLIFLSAISVILSALGWVVGIYAIRQLKRYRGVMQGEGAALIGYWGNLIVLVLSFFFFLWLFLTGIMRGEFI